MLPQCEEGRVEIMEKVKCFDESQSYFFSFNYYALEIHEAKMPRICKLLVQGQIVPEMPGAVVYGG